MYFPFESNASTKESSRMESECSVSEPPGGSTATLSLPNSHVTPATFRERHFPESTDKEWNDWKWQMQNSIRTSSDLKRFGFAVEDNNGAGMPMAVTPYYLSLMNPEDPSDPLRKCMVPSGKETVQSAGEEKDPLHEDKQSPFSGLIHRYPDRVLVLTTDVCSCYCRYCTRSRLVGRRLSCVRPDEERWRRSADYVRCNPQIRDVILSGGDPLTMTDSKLYRLLEMFRSIEHVEVIRIGTKVPMVLPQRVTPALCKLIAKFHPVWMSIHVTHPRELTQDSSKALAMLADAGIPLGSQTVLLKDVNDDQAVMADLMRGLMKRRVRPYYLYQCDPIVGSAHFRTTIAVGRNIVTGLRGKISGYAIPNYVIDAPGGGGKVLVSDDNVVHHNASQTYLKNYQGDIYTYPSPE